MDSRQLKKYNWENPPDHAMPRTQGVIDNYQKYLKSEAHETFKDGVIKNLEKNKVFFVVNLFPYYLKPPIKHSCLWYKESLTPQEVEDYLLENNIKWITYFENPSYIKSVKEISHYHIFYY